MCHYLPCLFNKKLYCKYLDSHKGQIIEFPSFLKGTDNLSFSQLGQSRYPLNISLFGFMVFSKLSERNVSD